MNVKNIIITVLLSLQLQFPQQAWSQTTPDNLSLARAYLTQGLIEKASEAYEKVLKKKNYDPAIHREYTQFLLDNRLYKIASKYLNVRLKESPNNFSYLVDVIALTALRGKAVDRLVKQLGKKVLEFPQRASYVVDALFYYDRPEIALNIYSSLREKDDRYAHAYAVGEIHRRMRNYSLMFQEYFTAISRTGEQIEYIQQQLKSLLFEEKWQKKMEQELMKTLAKAPNNRHLLLMVRWFYGELGDFEAAFNWLKIAHKRRAILPIDVLTLGKEAFYNGYFAQSIAIFTFLKDHFQQYHEEALFYMLSASESLILPRHEVSVEDLQALDGIYQRFITQYQHRQKAFEVSRKRAYLYAFYYDDVTQAEKILTDIINHPKAGDEVVAHAMLDLGDILLKQEKFWEASLAYFRVEKRYKATSFAQAAKLKNAEAMYYVGNFCLSLSFFDILKRATFKRIANDALYWGQFIRSNLADDCKKEDEWMKKMSKAHGALLSRRYAEAEALLLSMVHSEGEHPVKDDAYYALVRYYQSADRSKEALALVKQLLSFCGPTLTEKAVLLQAELLEKNGAKIDDVLEIYFTFIADYPNSPSLPVVRRRLSLLRAKSN